MTDNNHHLHVEVRGAEIVVSLPGTTSAWHVAGYVVATALLVGLLVLSRTRCSIS
jgi:hypothetical protein